MTNFDSDESLARFERALGKMGVDKNCARWERSKEIRCASGSTSLRIRETGNFRRYLRSDP